MTREEVEKLLELYDIDDLVSIGGFTDLVDLLIHLYDSEVLERPEVTPL